MSCRDLDFQTLKILRHLDIPLLCLFKIVWVSISPTAHLTTPSGSLRTFKRKLGTYVQATYSLLWFSEIYSLFLTRSHILTQIICNKKSESFASLTTLKVWSQIQIQIKCKPICKNLSSCRCAIAKARWSCSNRSHKTTCLNSHLWIPPSPFFGCLPTLIFKSASFGYLIFQNTVYSLQNSVGE